MKKRHKIMLFRLAAAVIFLIPALILSDQWIGILFFVLSYIVIGYDVLSGAVRNIWKGQLFDENFLMAIATVGAWILGEFTEAVAVMLFYQLGELFQSLAVGKSRKSIAALMDIRPDRAVLLKDDIETVISPEDVQIGDILIVRPGEKIPLDGVVEFGQSQLNTAALTGESLPRFVEKGDRVISGTVNMSGLLHICVTDSFAESTVNKILDLVENAAEGKAKTERFISRFSKWYTPAVVGCALLLAIVPPLIFGGFSEWIHRALIFLVVSCPCALVISVPLSFFGGIGGASRKGILIKGANFLETLAKVKTVSFDKTGTLTKGNFSVIDVQSSIMPKEKLLALAALAESYSNHPIAESIIKAYGKPLQQERVGAVREVSGKGLAAQIDGEELLIGNDKLLQEYGIVIPAHQSIGSMIHLVWKGDYLGYILIADEIKEEAEKALRLLKKEGVSQLVMLTGDHQRIAKAVGDKLGIDQVAFELLPHQKVARLEQLLDEKTSNGAAAFVGDGINDAPVLTRADIGIAMGALGSDAALEAADVVLMDDDLCKLPLAIKIAKSTMKIVWQNIIFAIGIKVAVMILGAFGLAGIWLAVFADVGVMVLAILNAMRALKL